MFLHESIARSAQRHPDKPAVFFRDHVLTYAQLWGAVQAAAAGFRDNLGIQPGDRVGIVLPNVPQFVIAYHALSQLGAIAVPVNPLLKAPEIQYIWNNAGVVAAITFPMLLQAVLDAKSGIPSLRDILIVGADSDLPEGIKPFDSMLKPPTAPLPSPAISPEDPAVFIYTSGTTGFPKGVMLTHRNILSNIESCQAHLEFGNDEVILTVLPLFHSFGQTVCMNYMLWLGGAICLVERFTPALVLENIEKRRVTIAAMVPAMYGAILQTPMEREYDLSSLKFCVSGGSPMPEPLQLAFESKFNCAILEGDGPTECSPVTSVNPIPGKGSRKIGSVGVPVPGVEIKIFDDDDRELPQGEIGEIVVRGPNVMKGYYNDPESTAEAMRSGWYHTGDMGRFDEDGYLYIVDRKKDMIIVGGINVYPSEVENSLLRHPAVADVAVIGLHNAERGEIPCAVIVPKPGVEADAKEIMAWCRHQMAIYKAPRQVIFRTELPRSATGKVVKRLLKKELEMEQGMTEE